MTPPFLLDTNTCIEYLRKKNPIVITHVNSRPPSDLRLCSVVLAELYYGACKSASPAKNFAILSTFVPAFLSLYFDDRAARVYGDIRAVLEAKGTPIGPSLTRSLAYFLVAPANKWCGNGSSAMAPAAAELRKKKSRRFISAPVFATYHNRGQWR